jgi:hypothetical protein
MNVFVKKIMLLMIVSLSFKKTYSQALFENLPIYMNANKEYVMNDLSAQGIKYINMNKEKSGLMMMTDYLTIALSFSNNGWCEKNVLLFDESELGVNYKKTYYDFFNDNYIRLQDGTWLVNNNIKRNVNIRFDNKMNAFILEHYDN